MDAPPRVPLPGSGLHGQQNVPIPGYLHFEEPSPPETLGSSNYTTDQFESPPAKRQRLTGPGGAAVVDLRRPAGNALPRTVLQQRIPEAGASSLVPDPPSGKVSSAAAVAPVPATKKAKRKRSGCLTCRDRHISCDEEFAPDCANCRKSNRECLRGTRLNFHQIEVKEPPHLLPRAVDWSVNFKDESRAIASEYVDGVESYVAYEPGTATPSDVVMDDIPAVPPQRPQSSDVAQGLPVMNNPSQTFAPIPQPQTTYASGSRGAVQREQTSYVDWSGQQQDFPPSRGNSDTYMSLTQPQNQVMSQSQQQTNSGFGNPFSLSNLDAQFAQHATRDDPATRGGGAHSYRSSDVSSVTSSLVPIGAPHHHHQHHASQSFSNSNLGAPPPNNNTHQPPPLPGLDPAQQEGLATPPTTQAGERDYLSDPEEIYYFQSYISDVAIWMDSFDHEKHFSRLIPFHALKSPMLLNALLACGIKHLVLTDKPYDKSKVEIYYDTATSQLMRSLQNPDRNMAECAATAAVLNVYDIMSDGAQARMSHIAGARALIRECNWNATSKGIGRACFWLNIGMEVLSCLAFNWQTAWDPDQWGLDVRFLTGESDVPPTGSKGEGEDVGGQGEEEAWVHRIFYIVARIANFKARIPRFQEPSPHDEQLRLHSRFAEWTQLKAMSDRWNDNCPRPMRPLGYAVRRSGKSLFPNIWLIRRAAVVGRLFYHTAMCLLFQINPIDPADARENREAQLHHAHQVCGIVAHTSDHGVASVSIRSVAIAASVLTDPAEQKEVMVILERIHRDTGWNLGNVLRDLKKSWGWCDPSERAEGKQQAGGLRQLEQGIMQQGGGGQGGGGGAAAGLMAMAGRVNPLLARADFRNEDRPYRTWYRPPNGPSQATQRGMWY